MPSGISTEVKELPADEQFERVRVVDFTKNSMTALATLKLKGFLMSIKSLSDYERLATAVEEADLLLFEAGRWSTDREFGRQMLNGMNPIVIRRCTAIPKHFPVTNELVKGSMCRGLTLNEEMQVTGVHHVHDNLFHYL